MGFPPWYMKYTVFNNWGKSGEVELEWMFVAFITGYDFIKEADAWHPSHMTNASVYTQYQMSTEKFVNNDAKLTETFLKMGYTELSMAPGRVLETRKRVCESEV